MKLTKPTRKQVIRAFPLIIGVLLVALICLVRRGTGYTQIITVKTLYDGQVEKAYELNTPEENLADALVEVTEADGQDFSAVQEIYINGEQTDLPLSGILVKESDIYELVYKETQIHEIPVD